MAARASAARQPSEVGGDPREPEGQSAVRASDAAFAVDEGAESDRADRHNDDGHFRLNTKPKDDHRENGDRAAEVAQQEGVVF